MAKRTQEYRSDDIVVTFDPDLCIHVGQCAARLPDVFKPGERPWVLPGAGAADAIAAVVRGCPSGALQYERLDGGPAEVADEPTTIQPRTNGPLFVRGSVRIVDARGETIRETTRATLCRCGGSANKPFCDLSHRTNGWRSEPRSPSAAD